MPESLSNIAMVCEEHASRPDPQYLNWPLEKFVGGFVKVAFEGLAPDGSERQEHMWVEVESIERARVKRRQINRCLKGKLNNDPVLRMQYEFGSTVFVYREEIEDFMPPKSPRRLQ